MAIFRHGDPVMIDYTPLSAAVATGDVIVFGAGLTTAVAHHDIAQNALGALAAGDGVYEAKNLDNSANGTKVYWDATNHGFTSTSTGNSLFGYITAMGGGGVGSVCRAIHEPHG